MNAKSTRPSVFGLDNLMVGKASTKAPESTTVAEPTPPKGKDLSTSFRTSVYFARPVHDKLRLIAFEERKTITDLINEGLDHVLASRGYPPIEDLKKS